MTRTWIWIAASTALVACATPPPPKQSDPLWVDGVMQKPLTVKEAERRLRGASAELSVCYRREQLNMNVNPSSYTVQVWVPTDGSTPDVEVVEETVPGQTTLRECVVLALERLRFPKHVGEPLTLRVPIKGD